MVVMKKTIKALALIVAVVAAATATAQDQQAAAPDTRVIPRNEFGHISFAGSKENPGNWNGLLGSLANRQPNQRGNIPENMPYDQVPFQDWAREEHAARTALAAGARRLAITHVSQRYPSVEAHREEARAVFPETVALRDLDRVPIPRRRA